MTKILRPHIKPVNLIEVKGTEEKAALELSMRATLLQTTWLKATLVKPYGSVTVQQS